MAKIAPPPKLQFFDANGNPLVGGLLYSYAAGTTTPLATYTDQSGSTANANPVILNSRGEASVWFGSATYKLTLRSAAGVEIWTVDNLNGADDTTLATLAASGGSNLIGFIQAGTNPVARTTQSKLRERVSVKDFGAVCDGSTDDTAAVQLAILHCATFSPWATLVVPGRCRITSSLTIDRPVDANSSEFLILGEGPGAGFNASSAVTFFTSSISMTTAPVSEFVTFQNIRFEAGAYNDETYAISSKFLRIKFINCFFWLCRCQLASTVYCQTLHFIGCNIRNNKASFINAAGLYDVTFDSCIIENGNTLVRSVHATYGCSGLRLINNVIEGIQGSIVVATGVNGFLLTGNHMESNFSPEFNFFAGSLTNGSVCVVGNYIYNPVGATFYYGPTTSVFSAGNTVTPSTFHSNANQVVNLISAGDNSGGALSDATVYSSMNGVYRAGSAAVAWTDASVHLTKSSAGNFGVGIAALSTVRMYVRGANTANTDYSGVFSNSAGNDIMRFRNDRVVEIPGVNNYANDAAAASGGIPVGGIYRNGSVVQVRVT